MTTHASVLQRTLVLVRHSKASHNAPTDIERPLTPKGREMADVLARRLSGRLDAVDLLLVSPAARARQTADPMQQRLNPGEVRIEPEIYTLSLHDALPISARGEHVDFVPASAFRLRAVFFALRGACQSLCGPRHGPAHAAGDDDADLQGRHSLG